MTVEAVSLNEIIKSVQYKGGESISPPHSAPPIDKKTSSFEGDVYTGDIKGKVRERAHNTQDNHVQKHQELDGKSIIKENIEEKYEKIKEKIQSLENTELKFERDKETKRDIIKILDKKTKKVIRQIPPKEFYKFIVELYKQNKKNTEKLERKELSKIDPYEKRNDLDEKGLILNQNI